MTLVKLHLTKKWTRRTILNDGHPETNRVLGSDITAEQWILDSKTGRIQNFVLLVITGLDISAAEILLWNIHIGFCRLIHQKNDSWYGS